MGYGIGRLAELDQELMPHGIWRQMIFPTKDIIGVLIHHLFHMIKNYLNRSHRKRDIIIIHGDKISKSSN